MLPADDRREFESSGQIEAAIARGLPPWRVLCAFRGIAFDVGPRKPGEARYAPAVPSYAGGALAGAFAAELLLGNTMSKNALARFAHVWLPRPLGIDLFMHSVREERPDREGLARWFDIHSTAPQLVKRLLDGAIAETLPCLAAEYDVVVRDDCLTFGPLVRSPAETAAAIVMAIESVSTLGAGREDAPAPVDVGPNAAFCYHCGTSVRTGTTTCPHCREAIEYDDADGGDGGDDGGDGDGE